jgi:hypothetical protein
MVHVVDMPEMVHVLDMPEKVHVVDMSEEWFMFLTCQKNGSCS